MCLLYFLLAIVVLMNHSDAARLGYDVIIAEDAVGDRDIPGASGAQVTPMVMAELGDAFGTVVKSSEIK
jgi:nicotinamidase-related amidase